MMMKTGFALLTAAAMFAAGTAFAASASANKSEPEKHTVTLRDGKVLEDAYILDKKPNGITLAYKGGCKFIYFSDMPLEYQKMFGYDPIKSARYEKKLNEQKKAAAKEESARKERENKRSEEDKHYKNRQISMQQQKVRKLELQLEEAKKRLNETEQTMKQDRESLGMSSVESSQASIESPWGYSGRIRTGKGNAAVTNKLLKEIDTNTMKRDNQAQEVMSLQLKLEAAQRTLDALLEKE